MFNGTQCFANVSGTLGHIEENINIEILDVPHISTISSHFHSNLHGERTSKWWLYMWSQDNSFLLFEKKISLKFVNGPTIG